MKNLFKILTFLLFALLFTKLTLASGNSFVSIVNPVRGGDFWDQKDQKPQTAVLGESEILKKYSLDATWLIRYDALLDEDLVNKLNTISGEKGLFLEVTPSWTKEAGVNYHQGLTWHSAGSAFLTGYEPPDREKLIDTSFEKFKKIFGFYPKSVGAWWVDSYSLSYMQKKYGITTSLIVADQYSTDNYQIWGQYFSTPYYPSYNNALHPAQNLENKLPVVMVQWASRDPVNSYGNGVGESTYSVQANDYIDYHKLDTKYFSNLSDIYTKQPLDQFSQIVVGLENSYDWKKYSKEYENQIRVLADRRTSNQISILTMGDFASWYKEAFPKLSPAQIIVADDPLGTYKKAVWFMNPYYRIGWFLNQDGSVFRDIRQYIDGDEELCYKVRCDSVNFATSATRVLDEVSFGHKWIIDIGLIHDFKVSQSSDKYVIYYKNEAGTPRQIEFLPRDISIDGKASSIDGAILDATKKDSIPINSYNFGSNSFNWSLSDAAFKVFKFLIFLVVGAFIPGYVLLNKIQRNEFPIFQKMFLSSTIGLVILTINFYILGTLKLGGLIYLYLLINLLLFIKLRLFKFNIRSIKTKSLFNLASIFIILSGTVFQIIPTVKNGLIFSFGSGFWGPNTHDGTWHMTLINQLIKNIPPQNPIFSGEILKNYHYLYDLLVAATYSLVQIPVVDLIFRFYPVLFSLSLGLGTYYLVKNLFQSKIGIVKTKIAVLTSLYLVYFAGSFGWIVSYIKDKNFAGESAFWANQSISFNLNPPFALSLLIVIALFQLLVLFPRFNKTTIIILSVLTGSLISFKAYAGVLILLSLFVMGLINLFTKKSVSLLGVFILSAGISTALFLLNFKASSSLFILAPFWFINSMIDSPDRVGWERLSLARVAGLTNKEWPKFITSEVISFFIFIFGNLGLRFLSIGTLFKMKSVFKDNNLLFIFIFTILSFSIPILFIQAGNPWNTIQFSYYGLYTACIGAGVVLSSFILNLPRFLSVLVIFAFLILAPINSITTATYYTNFLPHARVDNKELEALDFLSKQEYGFILSFPYDVKLKQKVAEPWPLFVYDSTAYVSAFSKKPTFLSDEAQNQILLTDYKKRLVASVDFFLSSDAEKKIFLTNNNIKYIYLQKIYNLKLDESDGIKKIFENEEVVIYKYGN